MKTFRSMSFGNHEENGYGLDLDLMPSHVLCLRRKSPILNMIFDVTIFDCLAQY